MRFELQVKCEACGQIVAGEVLEVFDGIDHVALDYLEMEPHPKAECPGKKES